MTEFGIRVKIDENREISVQSDSEDKVRKLADEVTEKYFEGLFAKKLSE